MAGWQPSEGEMGWAWAAGVHAHRVAQVSYLTGGTTSGASLTCLRVLSMSTETLHY